MLLYVLDDELLYCLIEFIALFGLAQPPPRYLGDKLVPFILNYVFPWSEADPTA